jgi:glyoxylase-like metal-dependent hydrolase (beta-lactamase superfamily II)
VLIDSAVLWLAGTNCWVIAPGRGGAAVVVDAPPDAAGVADLLARNDLYPTALLLTHAHIDHLGAAGSVASSHQAAVYLHPDDEWLAADPEAQLRTLWGALPPGDYTQPDRYETLAHGQVLDLAGLTLEVVHTPGHTPGHCCFHVPSEGLLFSGDQLFAGSIGRTDLPGGDHEALMRSMKERIVTLPVETRVLPGHGPTTTLSHELATNPFLEPLRT